MGALLFHADSDAITEDLLKTWIVYAEALSSDAG